jgi:hypothetical protein
LGKGILFCYLLIETVADPDGSLLCSFSMSYAMTDLTWKFYLINASWNIIFGAIVYFCFPETKGVKLEDIAAFFDGRDFVDSALADISHEGKEGDKEKSELRVVTEPQ